LSSRGVKLAYGSSAPSLRRTTPKANGPCDECFRERRRLKIEDQNDDED